MIIRIVAFGVLLATAVALVHSATGTDHTNEAIAQRGASRLVDDLLVSQPGDALLNETCTGAFFERDSDVCGFDPVWTDGTAPYLNSALGVASNKHINVTITTATGEVATLGATPLAMGNRMPEGYGTVLTWHRLVGIDLRSDGTVEWWTVTVRVWGRG